MYNESEMVASVISGLRDHFDHVLCVDDGSTDRSGAIAQAAGAFVVRHPVNLGQGAALQTGFEFVATRTSATHCVTFDADGQHRPADAARMVERARATGVDVVLASRFLGSTIAMPWLRALTLRGALLFSRWNDGLALTDTHNGLRVLSRRALTNIRLSMPRMAYASELQSAIATAGLSYVEEPVQVTYTAYSRSKGQGNLNAFNIVFDLAAQRLRAAR
jgi:glycosyltransferase involved in cell wall biosynthesis